MKILYLTHQTYLHGGIEKVLSQKANYLAEVAGDDVIIVTCSQQNKLPVYAFSGKIKMIDMEINYENGKSYFHPDNLFKIPQHRTALKNIMRQIQPDIVISCSFGPDFYFLPFLEKQIPKIKEFHSSRFFGQYELHSLKAKLLNFLSTFVEKKYDQLVVLNETERTFFEHDNVTVIGNPAERSGEKVNTSAKKIMAAGRISPVKNFGDLIDAFARVQIQFPEWELHFFGEDYLGTQQKLQHQIDGYGLEGCIAFCGSVSDLKKEMQNYSIYAMTSETECFPMVLLESLAVGMPVISYDCPTGPQHILKNEDDSFLVPYKNLDIFTEKLQQLMQSETLRREMGRKGIENVSRFRIEKVMQQWKNLYIFLMNKKNISA